MAKALSLIIPTYNEKDNIVPLTRRLHTALYGLDFEVIFIDDDSHDGTAEVIRKLEGVLPVRVIVRKGKKGLASAVVDGIGYAESDIVGVMDADLQHPPEVIRDLLAAIQAGADVAVASRYVKGGTCEGWGRSRKIISAGAVTIAHLFLPETRMVRDPMSGFFMFKKTVVAGANLAPTGYKILLEILVKGRYQKLVEVPYRFSVRQEGKSKLNARQQVAYLKHVYGLMDRRRELWRFARFCLVGGSGVLVNWGILRLLTELVGLKYYISAIFSIEASIISNFFLNDNITFADRRRSGQSGSLLSRLGKFNITCAAGAAIQYGLLVFFTEIFGLNYQVSLLIGIAAATIWNYTVNVLRTWR